MRIENVTVDNSYVRMRNERITVVKPNVTMRIENVIVDRPYVKMRIENVIVDRPYVRMRVENYFPNCRGCSPVHFRFLEAAVGVVPCTSLLLFYDKSNISAL